jgi:hypothetical protein
MHKGGVYRALHGIQILCRIMVFADAVFHVSLLYGHPMDEFGRRPSPPPPVITPEGEEEYEVEKILNSRKVGRQLQYLIRWKGYGPEEDTWQPKADVANAPELVRRFHQQHLEAPGP